MIYPTGRYNLNFDICSTAICIYLIIYLILTANLKVRRVRMFFFITVCMLLCSSGELAMDICRNDNGICFANWQAELFTFISHLTHNSVPFLLTLYFFSITGLLFGMKTWNKVLLCVPEVILVFAHIIPPVRHLIYYYSGDCEYFRGPLYQIYFWIVAFYTVYGIGALLFHHSAIQERTLIYSIILCAGYIAGMAVGMINTYIRVTNFIQSLVLSASFLVLADEESMLDKVTGVYNTNGLIRDSYPLFQANYRSYVLSIKLQHFNYYRLMVGMDTMTHILHQMGAWMLSVACEERTFYRVGNGEFAVLLFNAESSEAENFAEKIRKRFSIPWKYGRNKSDIAIPAQVWVSSIPDRISTQEQVLAFSEMTYNDEQPQDQIYISDEIKQEERETSVNVAIRRAIKNDSFEVYYQPIYDTITGKIHSCEALIRMTDPDLGPVSPEEFIKVAERTGTVSQIGLIVFEKVCRFFSEKSPERYGIDFIEVNLSPIQCMDRNLVKSFTSVMDKYNVDSGHIVLEITESAVIHNEGRVNSVIRDLKNAGFKFALDDFGTGQANYSYIRNFPFSIIKIDKSFLWAAEKDNTDKAVLHSMLSLVKDLKLQTVVEGVETRSHRDTMIQDGVDYLQGYYYSKPIPGDQFISYVRQFNKNS